MIWNESGETEKWLRKKPFCRIITTGMFDNGGSYVFRRR